MIASIFHGTTFVESHADGYLAPRRFTGKQLKFYQSMGEKLALRSLCSAGIKIVFRLNSKAVFQMQYKCIGFIRDTTTIDLFVNSRLLTSYAVTPAENESYIVYRNDGNQAVLVEIYLTNLAECQIKIPSLEGVRHVIPSQKTLLLLGDSISQGVYSNFSSNSYSNLLDQKLSYQLLNQSVGAMHFDHESLDEISLLPHTILIAYGTNDYSRCSDFQSNFHAAKAYLEKLLTLFPNAKVYLLSPIWRTDVGDHENFIKWGNTLLDLALALGMDAIDGQSLIPHEDRLFFDGLHPNDEGFAYMAENVCSRLESST